MRLYNISVRMLDDYVEAWNEDFFMYNFYIYYI